ncbi:hypothetical protein N7501_005111 [Penicillium viridicatum]|nr:hypothetical protein N7501_005111 [Penicillium viridicatum]
MSFFKPREKAHGHFSGTGYFPRKEAPPPPPLLPPPLKSTRSTKPTNFRPVRLNGTGWVKLDDYEAQLAAYLGFQNTSDLRAFAISWPSLLAQKSFAPAAKNMKKMSPFTLLHNSGLRSQIAAVTSSPESDGHGSQATL